MRRFRIKAAAVLAGGALMLTGCAVGTGGADDAEAKYDPDAELTGELSVMGFGGVDEVATTRMDLAKKALGDGVEAKVAEGELDLQQFLSAAATGDPPDLIYANRDQLGSLAARGGDPAARSLHRGRGHRHLDVRRVGARPGHPR